MKFTTLKFSVYVVCGYLFYLLGGCMAEAQQSQFSQGTSFTTTSTNSGTLQSFPLSLPMSQATSLSITTTNPVSGPVTNNLILTLQLTNQFIYSNSMGTNFSTNFNGGSPIVFTGTATVFGQALQGAGLSNGIIIK